MSPQTRPDLRPNIVFVLADDLGYNDLSTDAFGPGSAVNETPAIDRLAREGLVATNAYSAPSCAPTRMALLTGLDAPRADNNTYQVNKLMNGVLDGAVQGQAGVVHVPEAVRTVGETARDAGYATGYVGKFHVALESADIASQHGFEENAGGRSGSAAAYHATDGHFHHSVAPGLDAYAEPYTQDYVDTQIKPFSHGVGKRELAALVGTDKHVTDAVGDAMLDMVGTSERPTFTMVSHYAVHAPVEPEQARQDLRAKYADAPLPGGAGYAGIIEGMDQTVARLVRHLETTPDPRSPGHTLDENTVVMLTSDNGGRTDKGGDNSPWSGQKFELREGGVRVPFVAWSGDPALVRPGTTTGIVENVDLHPTIAEYAGVGTPTSPSDGRGLDGLSLVGVLSGASRPSVRDHVAHLPGYYVHKSRHQRPQTSLRRGNRKLTYSYEDHSLRLVDLRANPGEKGRAVPGRRVLVSLGRRMAAWLARTRPPLARLPVGASGYRVRVPAGSLVYRDRRLVEIGTDRRLTVRPGQEAPFVLRPDGTGGRGT